MAAGDLIVANYQYEYNGLLMGANTPYTVTGLEGLWDQPETRTFDLERNDGHGDLPGEDLLASRKMVAEITATADTQVITETQLLAIATAFAVRQDDIPFVWQRPGQVKKCVFCRPRRRSFKSDYEMARGVADGVVELYSPDPTIYSLILKTQQIVLAAGNNSGSTALTNAGFHESWPKFTLTGAGSNPRFANQQDSNRQVKIDLTMAGGDTLVVDTHPARRTVFLNGVDRYDLVRADNQWWRLLAGANTVTFSRTATTGVQTLTVDWRDAWT
jgi:hypothetical protein